MCNSESDTYCGHSGRSRAGQAGNQPNRGLLRAGVGVEIVGGGFEVGVAEEFLDRADIHSVADEVGGEGVAQHVGRDALGEAGSGKDAPQSAVQVVISQSLALGAEEEIGLA